MLSTPKSALLKSIETKGTMTTPDKVDVLTIDAAFFLHLHKDLPANYLRSKISLEENFTKGHKGDSLCF